VSKLLGYDLTVEYRSGKLNGVADALSRRAEEVVVVHAILTPTFKLFEKLRSESKSNPQVAVVRAKLLVGEAAEGWSP
jgi:hypothetical protein